MTEAITKDKVATKLSVKKPGHWRNRWWIADPGYSEIGVWRDVGEYVGGKHWPSAEVAEQKAIEALAARRADAFTGRLRYLGPVFIPDPP